MARALGKWISHKIQIQGPRIIADDILITVRPSPR
jgi:hypothetical protein